MTAIALDRVPIGHAGIDGIFHVDSGIGAERTEKAANGDQMGIGQGNKPQGTQQKTSVSLIQKHRAPVQQPLAQIENAPVFQGCHARWFK